MLILPHRASPPPAGLLAREALRGRGLELPERRLYVPERRIRLPGRDVDPRLRRAITVTNINTGSATTATSVTVNAVAVAIGNLVVVAVDDSAAAAGTVTDTKSNSYALLTSVHPGGSTGQGTTQLFWSVLTAALTVSDTIKYTTASGSSAIAVSAFYATGCVTTSPVDTAVTATASGTGNFPVVTGGTPGQSGELWVGVAGVHGTSVTLTNPGSWNFPPNTIGVTNAFIGGGTQVGTSSAPSYTPTLGGTVNSWGAIVAAFKAADVLMAQILM